MRRKSFSEMQCPVAQSLERVGEWWSILIMRDAFRGLTRFDEFQKSLDIAPAILSRRLSDLVDRGLLRKHRYCSAPPRDEYVLTECGRDFRMVVLALFTWGNRHFAPDGKALLLVNGQTGEEADPVLVDRVSGMDVTDPVFTTIAGPAANERTRRSRERG